jgi:hypothetical protein
MKAETLRKVKIVARNTGAAVALGILPATAAYGAYDLTAGTAAQKAAEAEGSVIATGHKDPSEDTIDHANSTLDTYRSRMTDPQAGFVSPTEMAAVNGAVKDIADRRAYTVSLFDARQANGADAIRNRDLGLIVIGGIGTLGEAAGGAVLMRRRAARRAQPKP